MASLPVKPALDAEWAVAPDPANIATPDQTKRNIGWILEKPPLQYFNWWMQTVYKWLLFLDRRNPLSNMIKVTAAGAYAVPLGRSIYLWMDGTLGNQSVTLPAPVAGDDDGMIVKVRKHTVAGTLTVTGTVQGEVNPTVDYQHTEVTIIAFQGAWYWA